jgi:hypothetical protein
MDPKIDSNPEEEINRRVDELVDSLVMSSINAVDLSRCISRKSFWKALDRVKGSQIHTLILKRITAFITCSSPSCYNRSIFLPCSHNYCDSCINYECKRCYKKISAMEKEERNVSQCCSCLKIRKNASFTAASCSHMCFSCISRNVKIGKNDCNACGKELRLDSSHRIACEACSVPMPYDQLVETSCHHILCIAHLLQSKYQCSVCEKLLKTSDLIEINKFNKIKCKKCKKYVNLEDCSYNENESKTFCIPCTKSI